MLCPPFISHNSYKVELKVQHLPLSISNSNLDFFFSVFQHIHNLNPIRPTQLNPPNQNKKN